MEGGGGGGGGGEVRRVHVVYFLSRNGEMEQPHLIRVRQRARRDGVRLRDVKRWLSELRGKGMPDSFSWSYKRRYKTGYVWQDLADDDLITPVSDNEYVLKGSLTATANATAASRPSSSSSTVLSCPSAATSVAADHASPPADSARTDPTPADPFSLGDPKSAQSPETAPAENPDHHDEVSPEPPPPADEEEEEEPAAAADEGERSAPPPQHSDASTQTTRRRAAAAIPFRHAAAGSPLPVSDGYLCEIEEEAQREDGGLREEKKGAPVNDSSHSLLPGRQRGYAWCGGAGGRAFRSLLGCGAGAAEVDDSALLPIEPRRRGQPAGSSDGGGGGRVDGVLSGGSHRDPAGAEARESREGGQSWSRSRAAVDQKTKAVPAEAYKHAAEPSCSQCGRPFKPERLHAHMKSCRALRSQRRNMSSGKLQKGTESLGAMLSEEPSALFLLGH